MEIQYDDEWDGEVIRKKEYEKYKDNYYLSEHLENYGKYLFDDDYYKYHNMTPNQRSGIHSHNSWVILFICLIPFLIIVNGGAVAILLIIVGSIYAIKEEHNLQLYFKERDYRIANNLTVQEVDEYNEIKNTYGKELADKWKEYIIAHKQKNSKWVDLKYEYKRMKSDIDSKVKVDRDGIIEVDCEVKETDVYNDVKNGYVNNIQNDDNMETVVIPPEDIEVI